MVGLSIERRNIDLFDYATLMVIRYVFQNEGILVRTIPHTQVARLWHQKQAELADLLLWRGWRPRCTLDRVQLSSEITLQERIIPFFRDIRGDKWRTETHYYCFFFLPGAMGGLR